MIITVTKEELNDIDMGAFIDPVKWAPAAEYFDKKAGEEFYRLISFIASKYPAGSKFVDIGTYYGLSATALASNKDCSVVTYDVYDHITEDESVTTVKNIPNVEFRLKDCIDDMHELASADVIIIDVDPHDGIQEQEMLEKLREVGFRGLMILDDINLNDAMKKFWTNITEKKVEATKYGHWSGTGLVMFGNVDVHLE
jgi:predicted O-methyltransferase YrrM